MACAVFRPALVGAAPVVVPPAVRDREGGAPVNRRTFETTVLIVILMQPVLGLVRLWAHKAMATSTPGSPAYYAGELATLTVQR